MRKVMIQLWRNRVERNWSVQVNDKRHDFVNLMFVRQFVAQGVEDAKKALIEPRAN
jgi:hypothetical protein